MRPSIDAIREIHINTNLYTAEVGRTAGAVVDILTRQARMPIQELRTSSSVTTSPTRRTFSQGPSANRYSARTSSVEVLVVQSGRTRRSSLETMKGFARPTRPARSSPIRCRRSSSTTIPGTSRISETPRPACRGQWSPLPIRRDLRTSSCTHCPISQARRTRRRTSRSGNFIYNPARTQQQDTFDVRIDHNFSAADQFFARYSYANTKTFSPPQLPAVGGVQAGGTIGGNFPGNALQKARIASSTSFTSSARL